MLPAGWTHFVHAPSLSVRTHGDLDYSTAILVQLEHGKPVVAM